MGKETFHAVLVSIGQEVDETSRSLEMYARVKETNPRFSSRYVCFRTGREEMTIFVFMKKMNIKNKYVFSLVIISIMVAFLIHFPELVSLFDVTGAERSFFPDMSVLDVANEVFFTFVSLLLLFAMNTYVFGFNRQKARISWQKVLLSFVMTWCVNNLLGKGFVFLHHQFDIPGGFDALVHHYLHPLRDFIMSCVVTGSCYMIYLIRQSQQVQVENQQLRAENLLNQYEALEEPA